MTAGPPPVNRKDSGSLNRQIDENLKRLYDDTLEEGIPDRFARLIAQLKSADGIGPDDPDAGKG